MEQSDWVDVRNLLLCALLGIVLSRLSIGSVLMTIPILTLCPRVKKTSYKVGAFALLLAGVIIWTFVQGRAAFGTELWPLLLVNLYLPVVLTVGSLVWVLGSDYSSSSMRKFFWAAVPVFFMGLALSLYFASSASKTIRDALIESIMYLFPSDLLSVDLTPMVTAVVNAMMLVFAPCGVLLLAVPVVISDLNVNRYDEEWQYDFANMKLPDTYVWVFFASWAAALLCNWVNGVPTWALALSWNIALSVSVLYFIVGVSILVAFARRRTAAISAGKIVFMVVLACFIPYLNLGVAVALPILGVLETWIRFR